MIAVSDKLYGPPSWAIPAVPNVRVPVLPAVFGLSVALGHMGTTTLPRVLCSMPTEFEVDWSKDSYIHIHANTHTHSHFTHCKCQATHTSYKKGPHWIKS